MMEGPRHQHLHQEWQEPLEEHVPKNRLPKRLMLPWIREPRVAGGQEMTYGRSLQRHLYHFGLPTVLTEWAHLAHDRAGWQKLVTTPPSPFASPSCGNHGATPG